MPFDVRGGLTEKPDELAEVLFAQASKRFALGVGTCVRAVRAATTTTSRSQIGSSSMYECFPAAKATKLPPKHCRLVKSARQQLWVGQTPGFCHKQQPEDGTNALPESHKWVAFVKGADDTQHSKSPVVRWLLPTLYATGNLAAFLCPQVLTPTPDPTLDPNF